MKIQFLVIIILWLMQSISLYSQNNVKIEKDIAGHWKPNEISTDLFFDYTDQGLLTLKEVSNISGKQLNILSLEIIGNTIITKTLFLDNNWFVESHYTFISNNILECKIIGEPIEKIIYTKQKK